MRAHRWVSWLVQGLAFAVVFLATLAVAHRDTSAAPRPLAAQRPAATGAPATVYVLARDGLYRYDAASGALLSSPFSYGRDDPVPPPGTAFGHSALDYSTATTDLSGSEQYNLISHVVRDRDTMWAWERLANLRPSTTYPGPWAIDREAAAAAGGSNGG